jgi:Na+/H+ antiporter NhaD/arsenite permease-like protein
MQVGVWIFLLTYVGVALGRLPGLALDRTGFALLGALAMVVFLVVPLEEALRSIHAPTILLLYALMVVSAQLRLGGFYTWTAMRVSRLADRPRLFLAGLMLVAAVLSAVLANDIVCLAFTPVLVVALVRGGLNPAPYLIGLACASNIGSAATIIGNPQNMLIGQVGDLSFGRFLAWCGPPSVVSLVAAYGVIAWLYRGRLCAAVPAGSDALDRWPEFNRHQTVKGLVAVGAIVILFFTPVRREIAALAVAGVLLVSRRMHTRDILGLVDWHLITLFCGLFVVIHGLELTGAPARALAALGRAGVEVSNPYVLTVGSALFSNVVSNVPATMLIVKFLDPAQPEAWYVLALATTYAGNLITLGSIANLITFEQARQHGVEVSFREHARTGVPVTAASLLITMVWIAALRLVH